MDRLRQKKAFLLDMDGVVIRGKEKIPGINKLLSWFSTVQKHYMLFTNKSDETHGEIVSNLEKSGVSIDANKIYTSADATADFLKIRSNGKKVFVLGGDGVKQTLFENGFTLTEKSPDYVVVGETKNYTYDIIEKAVFFVVKGAKLIGTNPDVCDPTEKGPVPAGGALIAPIEKASGIRAYFVGKPNAFMVGRALSAMDAVPNETAVIGDRMDTDILAGIESNLTTVLVLSGISKKEDIRLYAYEPDYIVDKAGDIAP